MNYILGALVMAAMLCTSPANAQSARKAKRSKPAAAASKVATRTPKRPTNYHRAGVSVIYWQERIEAKKGAERTDIETQLDGIQAHYNYNLPFTRSAWRQTYEAAVAMGRLKGKGTTTTIADELKDQPWLSMTFTPALMGRSTRASEFGIGVPVVYRIIQWSLKGGGLEMSKDQSFSAGVSGIYINNFSPRNALKIALTYQHMWQTAAWTIGWELRL